MSEYEFFESKGLPYKAEGSLQLLSMLRTRGSKAAVVAETESGNVYIGYYPYIEATNVAASIKRVRRFKVVTATVFKKDD